MNSDKPQIKNNVPKNLPTGRENEIYISKETLESIGKIIIAILILIILSPIIKNNIVATYNDITLAKNFFSETSQKFPEFFPSLANAGENIGNFVAYESKQISENTTRNLASMIDSIYTNKEKQDKKCFYICEVE